MADQNSKTGNVAEKATPAPQEFPLYLMVIDDKKKFMTLREASAAYDSGWCKVEIGGLVLLEDFSVRDITDEEQRKISQIADAHSESK